MSNPGPWKIVSNSDETLMSSRSALPAPTTVPTSVEELERLQAQLKNSRRYKEHQDSAKRDALDLHITEVAALLKVARQKANPAHAVAPAAAAWAATAGAAAAAAGRRKLAGSCCWRCCRCCYLLQLLLLQLLWLRCFSRTGCLSCPFFVMQSSVDPGLSHWQIAPESPLLEVILDVLPARRIVDQHDGEDAGSSVLKSLWSKVLTLHFIFSCEEAMRQFQTHSSVTIGSLVGEMKINWDPTDYCSRKISAVARSTPLSVAI